MNTINSFRINFKYLKSIHISLNPLIKLNISNERHQPSPTPLPLRLHACITGLPKAQKRGLVTATRPPPAPNRLPGHLFAAGAQPAQVLHDERGAAVERPARGAVADFFRNHVLPHRGRVEVQGFSCEEKGSQLGGKAGEDKDDKENMGVGQERGLQHALLDEHRLREGPTRPTLHHFRPPIPPHPADDPERDPQHHVQQRYLFLLPEQLPDRVPGRPGVPPREPVRERHRLGVHDPVLINDHG